MTEKEKCEAEEMRDFWEETAVEELEGVQRDVESLQYELLSKYKGDSEAIHEIAFRLDEVIKIAKNRLEHWKEICCEIEAEEDGGDDTPYEPYDCVLDPVSEPFDYVAMGMGV